MKVLVDSCIWSLVLRRPENGQPREAQRLLDLIRESRVEIIGPIRQELLSGIRSDSQFKIVQEKLRPFPDSPISSDNYVSAARFYNHCRSRGIQASNTDFLICAVAVARELSIFSTDKDFRHLAKHLPITLFKET